MGGYTLTAANETARNEAVSFAYGSWQSIASELSIAPKTVAAHVEHILARLGAMRRTEVAAWVARVEFAGSSVAAD